jgi:hypothetical protein
MKLPVQTAAVSRAGHSWPVRRSSAFGGPAPGVEPADCKLCKNGPDPCKGNPPNLVECPSTGTCQCCPSGYKADPKTGGACGCKP